MPIPIFWPWVSPELLAGGLSGLEVGDVVADAITGNNSLDEAVVEALLALDVADAVGHAVEGPNWTIR